MMTRDCRQDYIDTVSQACGNMLHDAVLEYGMDGADFLQKFIQSGIAEHIEEGSPKYVAGKSGLELFLDVMDAVGLPQIPRDIVTFERSDVYWVGWILARYQRYSERKFSRILQILPYEELLGLYGTLHEADVQKSYAVFDEHFTQAESPLKTIRKRRGMTQEGLARESGVSLNTIRAYERKGKDIAKAQVDIVRRLSRTLGCTIGDLVD